MEGSMQEIREQHKVHSSGIKKMSSNTETASL